MGRPRGMFFSTRRPGPTGTYFGAAGDGFSSFFLVGRTSPGEWIFFEDDDLVVIAEFLELDDSASEASEAFSMVFTADLASFLFCFPQTSFWRGRAHSPSVSPDWAFFSFFALCCLLGGFGVYLACRGTLPDRYPLADRFPDGSR